MRVVCRMGREILDLAALAVRPGVRCDEIDTIVHEACMERKCYPSPLNYRKGSMVLERVAKHMLKSGESEQDFDLYVSLDDVSFSTTAMEDTLDEAYDIALAENPDFIREDVKATLYFKLTAKPA